MGQLVGPDSDRSLPVSDLWHRRKVSIGLFPVRQYVYFYLGKVSQEVVHVLFFFRKQSLTAY